jgi:hypothetical protein
MPSSDFRERHHTDHEKQPARLSKGCFIDKSKPKSEIEKYNANNNDFFKLAEEFSTLGSVEHKLFNDVPS